MLGKVAQYLGPNCTFLDLSIAAPSMHAGRVVGACKLAPGMLAAIWPAQGGRK